MSVGGELMMRAIFDAMAGAVFLSDHGDGCPLLDAAALPPVRLARRPVGGVIRRDGLTTFAPPLDLARRGADCRRLAQALPIFIDAVADDAARLTSSARALAPDAVAALRVRGGKPADPALTLIYENPTGADRIYLRRDLISEALSVQAAALMAAQVDEFDALTDVMAGGVIRSLRHGARLSEALLDPASLIDQPDARQIAAAIGEGRAVLSAGGGCTLFAPQLTGAPTPASLVVSGLDPGAPDPAASLPNAPGWTLRSQREGDALRIIARPGADAPPLVSVFIEIDAPDSPDAEVTEVTSGISRMRGAWEIWDEAQQQLELEESW